MSIAPEGVVAGGPRVLEADPGAAPHIQMAEVLRLQPGDRMIVHVDGSVGLGPGGAHKIAAELHEGLKLHELPFDVPVLVTAPGLRIEVLRP